MEFLIVFALALIGIAAVFIAFGSIREPEVNAAVLAPQPTKSRKKKQQRPKEEPLDKETEELIARELARAPTDMSTDSKRVEPTPLEKVRPRGGGGGGGGNGGASQKSAAAAAAKPLTAHQRAAAHAQGFRTVEDKKPERKQKDKQARLQQQQLQEAAAAEEEELLRKINLFCQNSKRSKPAAQAVDSGPKITVTEDFGHARSWGDR